MCDDGVHRCRFTRPHGHPAPSRRVMTRLSIGEMPPECPRCGGSGSYPIADTNKAGGQRWECLDCGKHHFFSAVIKTG